MRRRGATVGGTKVAQYAHEGRVGRTRSHPTSLTEAVANCVMSRARNSHHRKSVKEDGLEEVKTPRIHLDYSFMSREDEKASANALLVVADERTGSRFARATEVNGLVGEGSIDWLIADISRALKSWGHSGGPGQELIVNSDSESRHNRTQGGVYEVPRRGNGAGSPGEGREGRKRPYRRGG